MTLSELKSLLESTGYPVVYSHFTKTENNPVPDPPFICYLVPFSSNFIADGKVYHKVSNVQVELYTDKKDPVAEQKIEDVLNANDLPFQSTEVWIEKEKLYEQIYDLEMI